MAANGSSRCSRPDCLSAREELELLQGDLKEIERENEQLHDQLGAAESAVQQHVQERAQSQQSLEEKDRTITRLNDQVQQLKDEALVLQKAVAEATPSSSGRDKTPKTESAASTVASAATEGSSVESQALRNKNEALEKQLMELRAAIARETSANVNANAAIAEIAQESKDKRDELYNVLKENEVLRSEMADLQNALKKVSELALDYETTIQALHEHQSEFKDAIDEQTVEIAQLHTKMDQLESEKQLVEAKLIEMDERESDVDALLKDQKMKDEMEKTVLRAELEELRKKLLQQQQIQHQQRATASASAVVAAVTAVKPQSADHDVEEMEAQVQKLQELRIRDKNTIMELNQRILQQQSDLESLAEHVNVDAAIESAVEQTIEKQQRKNASTVQENSNLKRRLKEQNGLVHELELRQSQLEHELVEAQHWNAEYEKKAGLEEVVAYQKKLRKQLDKQQQENARLRHDLSEQIEATGKMNIAFERLKADTGKPSTFQYDDLVIENHLKGELAMNQAVMTQMEHQIQELEAERLRLLQKMREHARRTGQSLYESHGLTTEEWQYVEEFIDRVKHTPEVARRLLAHDSASLILAPQVGSSKNLNGVDSLEIPEVAKLVKENSKQAVQIEQLQLEVERLQAVTLQKGMPSTAHVAEDTQNEKPREHEGALKKMQDEITALKDAHERLVSDRSIATVSTAISDQSVRQTMEKKKAPALAQDEVESLYASDEEDEQFTVVKRPKPTKFKKLKTNRSVQAVVEPDVAATNSSAEIGQRSHHTESSTEQRTPHEIRPTSVPSAESIALAVTQAIEKRLALFDASRQFSNNDASDGVLRQAEALRSEGNRSAPSIDPLAFESEDAMANQMDVLKELNICLDELVETEAQNERLRSQLTEHENAFSSVMDQHTVLYQHFFVMHEQYTKQESALRLELQQAKSDNRDVLLKCQRYEATLHLVGPQHRILDPGDLPIDNEARLRSEIVELTRKTATFEVNEAQLKRKCQQLHDDLRAATSHNSTLEQEWLDMEKTLKIRILYLESWKQGADEMIQRMEKTLDRSVLKQFAEKHEKQLAQILGKYGALSEAHAELRVKMLRMHDLPDQVQKLQHENALLIAEKDARDGQITKAERDKTIDSIHQSRVAQLENERATLIQRIKDLEEGSRKAVADGDWISISAPEGDCNDTKPELEKENTLLYERISEVEQLYETLIRECAKYKDIAALAATQANILSKKSTQHKTLVDQQDENLRDLMASSDDHALVGQLQQTLMQVKASYQQFLVKYDLMSENQQQTVLKNQHLEMQMESSANDLSEVRNRSRNQLSKLEATISQVKERDLTVRNTKWEAFRKRIDALEEELRVEQERRKQLEQELSEQQGHIPLTGAEARGPINAQAVEISRLKSRIEAMETHERVLMGQLETAAKSARFQEQEEQLQTELTDKKQLNQELMRQVQACQGRITELIKQNGDLETKQRELASINEDLEIEIQQYQAQLNLASGGNNQRGEGESGNQGSQSPLMRRKVGMYEKDQAELQHAAQVTIASLKLLVEEKNTLIGDYQQKLVSLRQEVAQGKAQDRLETTQLNKKLYEENQRMIQQLKEAMDTIHHLERTGKDKKAVQAAQERHEHALKEWKQVEIALEKAKQTIDELRMEIEVLVNERNIAEARAGEALEEIGLAKDRIANHEAHQKQLETQLVTVKRDMAKRDEKMQLLRDAIIKLKEEFLKAEDRHAVEIAKAQHAVHVVKSKQQRQDRDDDKSKEEAIEQLASQIQMLQQKMALMKKQDVKRKQELQALKLKSSTSGDNDRGSKPPPDVLEEEIERLKRLLQEKVVHEARAIEELEKKLKIVEAQNAAFREASTSAPAAPADHDTTAAGNLSKSRAQWELEKKLQRRVDILTLRLKDRQTELDNSTADLEKTKERLAKVLDERTQQQRADQARPLAVNTNAGVIPNNVKQQLDALERQNQMLQETLVLKRKEWEDLYTDQMEKYEKQLKRVRLRLTQHGIPVRDLDEQYDEADLQQEEQRFLVSEEVQDELIVLGDELHKYEQMIIAKDTKLMETQLELESVRMEYNRLQRKQLHPPLQQQQEQQRGHIAASARNTAAKTAGIRSSATERLELEQVISNMKKVIDKLRVENEHLKKHTVSPGKMDMLRRKLKEMKDIHDPLVQEVEQLRVETSALKKDKLRLQQKLRAMTHRPPVHEPQQPSRSHESQNAEVSQLKQEVDALTRAVNEKDRTIQQLETQLDGVQDLHTNELKQWETQVKRLEHENAKLSNELAAFDADFFDEIEDLKYKYAQAIREKQQLLTRIRESSSSSG